MRWMRLQLARVSGLWLVFHLCLLISIPSALGSTMSASATECTCDHGGAETCPMHHPSSKSKPDSDPSSCSCRSAADSMVTLAASLIGPTAVLASRSSAVSSLDMSVDALAFTRQPLDQTFRPDSPPPRG
jgi:hypothetical protein